jgi:hypothetical protein
MNTFIPRIIVLGLLAAALAVAPGQAFGQSTNKSKTAGEKAEGATKKKGGGAPLNGKVAKVDKSAKTITVGETTVQITSETRIMKAGKPATLEDAVVGEEVGIYYVKGDDGKLTARSVRIGPRPEGAEKKEGQGKDKKKAAQ